MSEGMDEQSWRSSVLNEIDTGKWAPQEDVTGTFFSNGWCPPLASGESSRDAVTMATYLAAHLSSQAYIYFHLVPLITPPRKIITF